MTIQELEKYSPWLWFYNVKDQLKDHIYKRSEELFIKGDLTRDAVKSTEELERRQAFIRKIFKEALGGLPTCDSPLNAKVVETIKENNYSIEKILFESRPRVFVTANLYIPDGITSPRGAVLFVCGHHMQAKHADEYQIVCRYLVKAGLVVLAQDPIGQGERFSYYENSIQATTIGGGVPEHDYAGSQCWPVGDCIARYFVHDAMRGVDYLCTRPEVDPKRIGVTGNSGGGTQSSLMMLCDSRIAAAAPATFIMNRQTYMYSGMAQDAEQIWPGMTALGFDHEDILLAMVPKPVMVLAVTSDFFPIEGTRRSVERVKRFWEMYGKSEDISLFEDTTVHLYTRKMAKASAEFFSRHLLDTQTTPMDEEIIHIEPSLLWCTKQGQVRADIEKANFVFEENLLRIEELERGRKVTPENELKNIGLKWLEEKVFYNRKHCDLNPRHFCKLNADDFIVQFSVWWTQEGMLNYGATYRNYKYSEKDLPLTIAIWDGGTTQIQSHIKWIRETCNSGRAVMVLDTSGVGNIAPNPLNCQPEREFRGVICKLNHDLIWMDDSIAAMRTYDVLRALDAVELFPGILKKDITIYAFGRQGLYGKLAAALDTRIKKIVVKDGIKSYSEWVKARYYDQYDISSIIIPGMLKYFDLPDLDRWIKEMST